MRTSLHFPVRTEIQGSGQGKVYKELGGDVQGPHFPFLEVDGSIGDIRRCDEASADGEEDTTWIPCISWAASGSQRPARSVDCRGEAGHVSVPHQA